MFVTVVSGRKLFGRVDRVPGLFHVATEFSHLWYMPVIPRRTILVTSETAESWNGIHMRMSLKSVALAWVKTCLLLGWSVIGSVMLLAIGTDNHPMSHGLGGAIAWTGGCFLCWLALVMLPMRFRASHARAIELGKLANLAPDGWNILNAVYQH